MVGMATVDLASLPYRCPRCEEVADFPTLEALRRHLVADHSYSRCSREREKSRRPSPSQEVSGRVSPLTASFIRQRNLLEDQLKQARIQENASHKDSQTYGNTYKNNQACRDSHKERQCPRDYEGHGDGQGRGRGHREGHVHSEDMPLTTRHTDALPQYMTSSISHDLPLRDVTPENNESDSPLRVDDLDSVTSRRAARRQRRRDVTAAAASHRVMADALAKARGHVDSMKRTADDVVYQQGELIKELRRELKAKDERLDVARKQLSTLHGDRQRLLVKVGRLSRDQDQSADSIAQLKARLEEQDHRVQDKEREVRNLSLRLDGVSQEERVARQHLETYIRDLTSRAEQDETLLTSHSMTGTGTGMQRLKRTSEGLYNLSSPHTTQTPRVPSTHARSQTALQGAARTSADKVNHCAGPALPYVSSVGGSTPHYAPPTVNSISGSTPHYAPPTLSSVSGSTPHYAPPPLTVDTPPVASPAHTGSSSPEPSLLATSGYLSMTTGAATHSSAHYVNHLEKLTNGEAVSKPHLPLLPNGHPASSLQFGGVVSPLSPGEIIVNQPHWFKPIQSTSQRSGWGQEQEGAESELSDSQGSVTEHQALGTLSYPPGSATLDHSLQTDPKADSARSQQQKSRRAGSDVTRLRHRRIASWGPDTNEDAGKQTEPSRPLPDKLVQARLSQTKPDEAERRRDALTCVFRYLDTPALCGVSLVCREWRDVSRQPALWRKICLQRAAVSSKFLRTISRWCTELQSISLEGLYGRMRRENETTEEYKKAIRGNLEVGLEELLMAAADTLLSLRVVDCGPILTDRCLWLASCSSRLLQRVAYVSDSDPVGSEVIWALGAGCRQIQTLIIPPKYPNAHPHRFTDRCLTMTASCWPHLLVLCVGGVEISAKGLAALAKTCSRLQVLELDHACEVSEEAAVAACRNGLRGLHTLQFSSTPVTPRALLHFVSSCPSLQTVRIHVSISDYFQDTEDTENQRHYRDVISKLKLVQSRPGMNDVIHIRDTS